MKKFFVGIVVFVLVIALAGCGAREKAAERLAEKLLGDVGVNVDLDDDKLVIKGEDGQEMTFGVDEWPTSDLAKSIPELKDGKVVSVMEAENSLLIMVDEVSEKAFEAYLEKIKESFPEEVYKMNTDTGMMYALENGEGISITLTFAKDSGLSITVAKAEQGED